MGNEDGDEPLSHAAARWLGVFAGKLRFDVEIQSNHESADCGGGGDLATNFDFGAEFDVDVGLDYHNDDDDYDDEGLVGLVALESQQIRWQDGQPTGWSENYGAFVCLSVSSQECPAQSHRTGTLLEQEWHGLRRGVSSRLFVERTTESLETQASRQPDGRTDGRHSPPRIRPASWLALFEEWLRTEASGRGGEGNGRLEEVREFF